jgi:hypothetical protein
MQSFLWLCMGLVCLGRSQDCCEMVGAWGVEWDRVGRTIGDDAVPFGRFSLLFSSSLGMTSSSESSFGSLASRSVTCTPPNSFWRLASLSSYDSVKVLEMVFSVSAASLLGFQSMGQRTPCLATAWKASSRRRASSTLRPTVTLFNVIYTHISAQRLKLHMGDHPEAIQKTVLTCCTMPSPSMMNMPRKLTPSSSIKTP